jgi:hypothetical protein
MLSTLGKSAPNPGRCFGEGSTFPAMMPAASISENRATICGGRLSFAIKRGQRTSRIPSPATRDGERNRAKSWAS